VSLVYAKCLVSLVQAGCLSEAITCKLCTPLEQGFRRDVALVGKSLAKRVCSTREVVKHKIAETCTSGGSLHTRLVCTWQKLGPPGRRCFSHLRPALCLYWSLLQAGAAPTVSPEEGVAHQTHAVLRQSF